MKKLIIYSSAVLFTMSACVGKKEYQSLQTQHQNLQNRFDELNGEKNKLSQDLGQARTELASKNVRIESLEELLANEKANNESLKKAYAALQETLSKSIDQQGQGNINISKLVDEINASNRYIQHLVNTKNKSDSLNLVLTNNLTRSLSREELKDVDVQVLKGVVYISLSDNMLYKSGSYEVSNQAAETLSKIAKIILDYKDYDVLIEGNTDNVPINQTNIRNNWDLSVLRASSVVQVLQNQYGVDPKRLTAGGRGEYNPVAPNTTEAGKSKNRRTQIIITPKLDQFMELIDQAPESTQDTTPEAL